MEERIQTPLAPAKKRRKSVVLVCFSIVIGIAILIGLGVGGNLAYLNLTYDLPIFVNGASMYPYLNADAQRYDGYSYSNYTFLSGNARDKDIIDYGYGKTMERVQGEGGLKRYDTLVTYYPSDYEKDGLGNYLRGEDGKLVLTKNAAPKIKRVIGLPGETVTYRIVKAEEGESEFANPIWGETKVSKGGEEETLRPLYNVADYQIGTAKYAYPATSYQWASSSSTFTLELKEKEYLVAGDNRGYSSDGIAQRFAISEEMIVGKVFLMVGKCQMTVSSSGNTISPNYSYLFLPWTYRRIG